MNNVLKSGRYFMNYSYRNLPRVLFPKKCHAFELCKRSFAFVADVQPLATCQNAVRFLSIPNHEAISEPLSNDKFDEEISNLKTCDDIFNYLGNINQKTLNMKHILVALNHISETHYKNIWLQNNHLVENIHVSYIQLLLQGELDEIMKPILDHEQFQVLLKSLNGYCDLIDIDKVCPVTIALIHLNVHMEDPIYCKLINRIRENIPYMDHKSLVSASYVIKSLPELQSDLSRLVIKRLKILIETSDSPTHEELQNIITTSRKLNKLITEDTMKWIFDWSIKSVEGLNISDHPNSIVPLLKFFRICTKDHNNTKFVPNSLYSKLEEACIQNIHLFDMIQIQDLCRSFKCKRRIKENLSTVIGKKVEEILSDDARTSELVCASSSMSKYIPEGTIRKLQQALAVKLSNPEEKFDTMLLSHISDSLLFVDIADSDLIKFLQKRIAENCEAMFDSMSRFHEISKFLIKYPLTDPDDKQRIIQVVVKYIEGKHGLSLKTFTSLGSYVLALNNIAEVPNHVYLKLISSLPRWPFISLSWLLSAVDVSLRNSSREKKHFIELSNRIQQIVALKLSEAPADEIFYLITSPFLANVRFLNSSLTLAILSSLESVADNFDIIKSRKVLKFLNTSNYYVPVIYDSLVNQVIDDPMATSNASSVLHTCARANYVPKRMSEFLDILKGVYKKEFESQSYRNNLVILNSLALLNFYPKEELKEFFKLEVIQALEKIVEDCPYDQSSEYNLMNLNRCVVIECPELNIPWFHEHYCIDRWLQSGGKLNRNTENFKGEVYSYLIDVFGSSKYIKRESFSPFYHKIDFECALHKNTPIPANILDSKTHKDFQRLAVCLLHERYFCKESRSLAGKHHMRRRHLEVLNYRVVEIPYYEWYSMGMSEKSSKVEYLKEKINACFDKE